MRLIKNGEVCGEVRAPSSKSQLQRAIAMAVLANGKTGILADDLCDDVRSAIGVSMGLGCEVLTEGGLIEIVRESDKISPVLDCGESGLCLRMFCAVSAVFGKEVKLTGKKALLKRPIGMVEKPLLELGAKCSLNHGFAPVIIKGPMSGGSVTVDGSLSSQFLTGLLIALPACANDSQITVKGLVSAPYVEMTVDLLKKFGVKVENFGFEKFFVQSNQKFAAPKIEIEGDWSGASFLLVAGAIAGKIKVRGLKKDSLQADRKIIEALRLAGAMVAQGEDFASVQKAKLRSFEFDASDCPDLFPPLVALACNCSGTSVLGGAQRLVHKESDRSRALVEEFSKIGAKISVKDGKIFVTGSKLSGGHVFSHNDHRIAMACAVAGINSEKGVKIDGEQCVSKSYPGFFEDLKSVRCF